MGSIQNTVHYCCMSKGNRCLYEYSGGDREILSLAALCLERTPPFHKWYFETIGKRTFGFLMEDGYVYFVIADDGFGNHGVLQFLEHMRDEFRKVARKGSRGSFSGMNFVSVQEQLVPVIQRLITSLEHVSQSGNGWKAEIPSPAHAGHSQSPSDGNAHLEAANSTKAPLLGKSGKQEKKTLKEHTVAVRDIELEDRKSTDRGIKVDLTMMDSANQNGAGSSVTLQKDLSSVRNRASSPTVRKKWWRHVRIVLAIDAAVCMLLFVIWLSICKGIECTR